MKVYSSISELVGHTPLVQLQRFAAARGLVAVTADVTIASERFIAAFNEAGVPLAVHTVNGEAEQAALFSAGISTIYTDRVK